MRCSVRWQLRQDFLGVFAVSILAATRLTSSVYPTSNFIGQMITARCDNTKEALRANWIVPLLHGLSFYFMLSSVWNDLLKQFASHIPSCGAMLRSIFNANISSSFERGHFPGLLFLHSVTSPAVDQSCPARAKKATPEIRFSCALGITVPPSYLSSHVCPLHRVSNQTVPQTVVSSSECDAAASCIVHNPFDRWKGIFIEVSRIYEILFLWDLDAPTYLSPTADGIYLSRS